MTSKREPRARAVAGAKDVGKRAEAEAERDAADDASDATAAASRDNTASGDKGSSGDGAASSRDKTASGDKGSGDRAAGGGIEISLQHARNHHLRWVVIGLILGGLCVTQLGTLGQWVGVVLLVLAAWAAFRVIQTLRHPAGTIVVERERVTLPRGLCRGEPLHLRRGAITASYLLRKAVAWHQAAPVLVVEADGKVLAYPRDWFASEADQRRVLDALLGDTTAAAEPAA